MPEFDEIMPPAGVFAALTSPGDTTCTDADTWYPINGTFANGPIVGFSFVTDHIEYDGAMTRHFEIDGHIVVKGDGNGITIHFGVYKNGAIVPASIMGVFTKTSGEAYPASGTSVIELATGDEIQLVLMSDSAGAVITAEHLTTTIRPFGR